MGLFFYQHIKCQCYTEFSNSYHQRKCGYVGQYIAQRIRFQGGERHSVLQRPNGVPVHEVTLYLGGYRSRGRAANTIHFVCVSLALLYRELAAARVNLLERFEHGRFLDSQELDRLAAAAQYRIDDLDEDATASNGSNVISINRVAMRRAQPAEERRPVDAQTQASRLRYIADFLKFFSIYVAASLPPSKRSALEAEAQRGLVALKEHVPRVSKRAKLGARVGLSEEEQARVVALVHPDSPNNPWQRGFVRRRNWLIVVLLLATGMRRGELLGLQIRDLSKQEPKLRIVRRADDAEDHRLVQPNAKTHDREIELSVSIRKKLDVYLEERRGIKAARLISQVFVSEEGNALSEKTIDKIFRELREGCPGLPVVLTSHVMRHTWNERFSEVADAMGLTEVTEQRARNTQQGWADDSKTGATYTRRHAARKGREIALKLQEKLDDPPT
jgi:integrase